MLLSVKEGFLVVLLLILGPNFMFKALEQASMYGQTNVINTDSIRFTCMAVSTERSDAVGCTKSAVQLIFVEYSIQISIFI